MQQLGFRRELLLEELWGHLPRGAAALRIAGACSPIFGASEQFCESQAEKLKAVGKGGEGVGWKGGVRSPHG